MQPLLYVGAKSDDGKIWASALAGTPGFISSKGPKSLTLKPLVLGFGGGQRFT